MSQCLDISARQPEADRIAKAVERLQRGELIVLPTETVYGLAADPRQPRAELRLARAKGRKPDKPIARLAASLAQVEAEWGRPLPPAILDLAAQHWPGPLTLVLEHPSGEWIGFRVPDHPVALAVIEQLGHPILATSANRSGEPDATTAEAAQSALGDAVTLLLDAGPSPGGQPSTVLKVGERIKVLRSGPISIPS